MLIRFIILILAATSLTTDDGIGIDPNGSACAGSESLDRGAGLDPDGR